MKEFEYPEWSKDRSTFFAYLALTLVIFIVWMNVDQSGWNNLLAIPYFFSVFMFSYALGKLYAKWEINKKDSRKRES